MEQKYKNTTKKQDRVYICIIYIIKENKNVCQSIKYIVTTPKKKCYQTKIKDKKQ